MRSNFVRHYGCLFGGRCYDSITLVFQTEERMLSEVENNEELYKSLMRIATSHSGFPEDKFEYRWLMERELLNPWTSEELAELLVKKKKE